MNWGYSDIGNGFTLEFENDCEGCGGDSRYFLDKLDGWKSEQLDQLVRILNGGMR